MNWYSRSVNYKYIQQQPCIPGVRKALQLRYSFFISKFKTMKLKRFVFGVESFVITHFLSLTFFYFRIIFIVSTFINYEEVQRLLGNPVYRLVLLREKNTLMMNTVAPVGTADLIRLSLISLESPVRIK